MKQKTAESWACLEPEVFVPRTFEIISLIWILSGLSQVRESKVEVLPENSCWLERAGLPNPQAAKTIF